jgi:hypothetical protein
MNAFTSLYARSYSHTFEICLWLVRRFGGIRIIENSIKGKVNR